MKCQKFEKRKVYCLATVFKTQVKAKICSSIQKKGPIINVTKNETTDLLIQATF